MQFKRPTAKDIADYFASLPPETSFRISDPDTGWKISIFYIDVDSKGVAWLTASYGDMGAELEEED